MNRTVTFVWEHSRFMCNGVCIADIVERHMYEGPAIMGIPKKVYIPRTLNSEGAKHKTIREARAIIHQTFGIKP